MSKHCKPNCGPPLLNPGFSKYTQDVPQVGDVWRCEECGQLWVVTDHGFLYTNRYAPESWWRPVFWFDFEAKRKARK